MKETITLTRGFTTKDFAALRAYVQRVPPRVIARTYYDADEDRHAATPAAMDKYLRHMLDALVALAIEHGPAASAADLRAAVRQHGSARLTAASLRRVFEIAELATAAPLPAHGIGMWLRPLVARHLKLAGVHSLGDLIDFCNRRGGSWWRAVPRIGIGRARIVVQWLRQHAATLGKSVDADVDQADPLVAAHSDLVDVLAPERRLAPLERMQVHDESLSGRHGLNRATAFPYIAAQHDLEAVRAYLHLYRDQPKTLRAYTKELERFLLWAVTERGTPLSSLLVNDCEAYKDFLAAPSARFVGPRAPRHATRWRPFAADRLSPESQRYAVRALRAAFTWLVEVRYLAGNPWKAVKDPVTVEREAAMRIDRALPAALWKTIQDHLDRQCAAPDHVQWRTARAFLRLMADSGLRREEALNARREALHPVDTGGEETAVWALVVVGKRNRERTVPVSPDAIAALRAHWADRGEAFDLPVAAGPLLSPVFIPPTPLARRKHHDDTAQGYCADAGNKMVEWVRRRLLRELPGLSPEAFAALSQLSPHAFRHTFGTQAAAQDVPLDVVQRVLGHQSMQTTSIYVQAEKQRMMREMGDYYRGVKP
ncbi:site-specific integrase [Robbsia sp. Bb-Pol-6]|uniref:Site-specific integrase n=1 Tax=Robbsia betulipollinis TaxID=2981849 RepID=A0ABT3ZJP6_9BURK|nr:site-specific integrase [Robbsia betulipollinis]MCY0386567.1 site-specific integrase [Robbsia betulipollinis]